MGGDEANSEIKTKYKFDKKLIGWWVKDAQATQGVHFNEDGTMSTFLVNHPEKSGFENIFLYFETFEKDGVIVLVLHAFNEAEQEIFTRESRIKIENDTLYLPDPNKQGQLANEINWELADKYFQIHP